MAKKTAPLETLFEVSFLGTMAASGGHNYRDATQRSSVKVDRPLSANSNPKSSVKSKPLLPPRRNSTGSIGGGATGAASKDNTGGGFLFLGSSILWLRY